MKKAAFWAELLTFSSYILGYAGYKILDAGTEMLLKLADKRAR